jgi:hypothetical protein
MTLQASELVAELADREAIRDCLYRYSRGVDRCDEATLRSVYWADAVDDHCLYSGGLEGLIAWVLPLLRAHETTQHSISNVLIRLHGETADVESYFEAYHVVRSGAQVVGYLHGGRYLDRFARRAGEWRIAERKVVVDWFRDIPQAGDWTVGPHGHSQIKPGRRHPDDDSYTLLDLR